MTIRLVSTSDEVFSELEAWLLLDDDTTVRFGLNGSEVGPGEKVEMTNYFYPEQVRGHMRVKIRFQDANGRWWERTNGKPVKELSKRHK
ncbi:MULTISPECIES: hypothetical protein [unclassified Frigoribacterium]|uniref:hypothetical protein n=1 Tax=unclassified Frigoribacterium TaxID=2627005 RepID=UPI001564E6EF|nr:MULTISPECIES: hypothetical protein [unclassified Frigoribacterium]NQW87520.1 hypothetical protein [Frigoribacterium sp. VKM Ac-2860]NQX09671.1 hypothetical protein [Frigoribacterium sp. VKM Ac-2859]